KLPREPTSIQAVHDAVAPMLLHTDGEKMDVMVLACTHFPLLADELATTFPAIAQVDGGPGIARRIAYLTGGQEWPAATPDGIAVFTAEPDPALSAALAGLGLN